MLSVLRIGMGTIVLAAARNARLVTFVECLDYIDFISDLRIEGNCQQTGDMIKPLTARSILTAGNICVEIDKENCNGDKLVKQLSIE